MFAGLKIIFGLIMTIIVLGFIALLISLAGIVSVFLPYILLYIVLAAIVSLLFKR